MISEVWTKVAEPYRSEFLSEVDPTVNDFIDQLSHAVHDDTGPDLSDTDTFAAQRATVADLKSRFLDEQAGSYLDEMLHAARFCQAHQKFNGDTPSQLKSVNGDHKGSDMAQRFSHLQEQTIKIVTDRLFFTITGPARTKLQKQGALGVLSYLEKGLKDSTLATIPVLQSRANKVKPKEGSAEATVVASVNDLCDATEAFYRYRHRIEVERKAAQCPTSATQSSRG